MSSPSKLNIVSLSSSRLRRNHVARNFTNFDVAIYEAVDAGELGARDIENMVAEDRRHMVRYLTPGTICCTASHLKIYKDLLESMQNFAFIAEDDVVIKVNKETLDLIAADFDKQEDFDILLCEYYSLHYEVNCNIARSCNGLEYKYAAPTGDLYPVGAIFYLIKRKAAETILSFNSPIRTVADEWTGYHRKLGINIALLWPSIAHPANFPSSIEYKSRTLRLLSSLLPSFLKDFRRSAMLSKSKRNVRLLD